MRHWLSAVVLVVLLSQHAEAAAPVCALLDPEQTPRAALFACTPFSLPQVEHLASLAKLS